ncbi:MAG: protein kinase [Planctomycetota bacterium]
MELGSLERVVDTITGLGIGAAPTLRAQAQAYLDRPPSMETADEEDEVQGFLTHLLNAALLSEDQYRVLVGLLQDGELARPGTLVGQRFGSYVAQARLGEGAYAKVYRALRPGDTTPYVLKVCMAEDPEDRERFRREGELLAAIRHPNVIGLVDRGQERGCHYLVLECADGPNLQQIIEAKRYVPWETATRAVRQIALGLAAAHAHGVVHRDVKPANVLSARDGTLKVCDFGVSTLDAAITGQAGQILGSPAYIAPEQWGDHRVDARADLFALGVIYYQLLSGNLPFKGRTPADFSQRILAGEYASLRGLAQVPREVAAVVDQLLETSRRYRTPSAEALVADLERLLSGSAPNTPRLERQIAPPEDEVDDPPDVHYLVGQDRFLVGGATACEVWLGSGNPAMQQAMLERTPNGLMLRTADDGYPPEVNGQRIAREVLVKGGDVLAFSPGREFRYMEGNLDPTRPASGRSRRLTGASLAAPPVEGLRDVPGLVAAALLRVGHPAALLLAVEALDDATQRVERERSRGLLERLGTSAVEAEEVEREAERLWEQRRLFLADQLFQRTHENLGPTAEPWLRWWLEVQARYPLQVAPRTPRAGARLLIAETERQPRYVDLEAGERWTVGRSADNEIVLDDLSISRVHARLHRLVTRVAVVDLGSRQGVRRGGERVECAVLQPGESIELGRVRLRLTELPREEAGGGLTPVDSDTFLALTRRASPLVAEALIALLEEVEPALDPELEALGARAPLSTYLGSWQGKARATLGVIAGRDLGPDPDPWRAWLIDRSSALGGVAPPAWPGTR